MDPSRATDSAGVVPERIKKGRYSDSTDTHLRAKTPPYDNAHWAETMMARVVKPLIRSHELNWFWFTRYASITPEFADSDGTNAPAGFFDGQICRSLRFRIDIDDNRLEDFEANASALIDKERCWIADWRAYGEGELCSDRFLGEDRSDIRRTERLAIVRDYTESVCRLAVHALVPADERGRFRFEVNDNPLNPHASAFFSLHHLFCNATEVFLTVLVASDGTTLSCGTRTYPPAVLSENPTAPFVELRVRF